MDIYQIDAETRAQVAAEYSLSARGRVRDPGKFEGEPWYAVALYSLTLSGMEDETIDVSESEVYRVFKVQPDEREHIPELTPETVAVLLWETSSGFVRISEATESELARIRKIAEEAGEADENAT